MKKILTSLAVIAVVGAIVAGATSAFFSDTETSAGNTFTAGSIDLKIDHVYQSYNNEVCEEQCDVVGDNLVLNGGFEQPVVGHPSKWNIFPSGYSDLEWIVEWRNDILGEYGGESRPNSAFLELHKGVNGWMPDEGEQYAELDTDWTGPDGSLNDEPASVVIYQDIPTVTGEIYQLSFAFSPRPNTGTSDNHLKIKWGGTEVDTIGPVAGGGSMNWTVHTYNVVAPTDNTRLQFEDLGEANSLGTFLDDVQLRLVECDYQIPGGICELWEEKDLEDEMVFYFNDIKPGDKGKNILSLHVHDNDAWACMYLENMNDDENTLVEPETELGDTGPEGELSQFIDVFMWWDDNENNQYDDGEPVIAEPSKINNLFGNGGIVGLADYLNGIVMEDCQTKYLGIAWCAGDMTVEEGSITCCGDTMTNIAQSDIFSTDIVFYTVQHRNNTEFSCQDLNGAPEPE